MDCRGTIYFTMVSSMGCRAISTQTPGAPPPPSFFADLGVCRVVSHFSHSSLSHSCCAAFSTLS